MRDAGRGSRLDLHTRSRMERRLGGDFGNVRIVRGPLAEEITNRYRADAVTVGGTDLIMVREGWQSNFQSAEGTALRPRTYARAAAAARSALAHSGGDDEKNSEHEREAYGMQTMVRAEEQGRHLAGRSDQAPRPRREEALARGREAGAQAAEKEEEAGEVRDGSSNLQANTQAT